MKVAYWPGMGGGRKALAEVQPVLAGRGIEAHVVDPRYTARTDWSLGALADELVKASADAYAGSSWGGAVAATAAARRAPRALVLLDGGAIGPDDFPGFGAKPTREARIADLVRQYREEMRWPTTEAYLEWHRAASPRWTHAHEEMALEGAHVGAGGEVVPAYDCDTLTAIAEAYEDYDPPATLRALAPSTRVLLVAAVGIPAIDDARHAAAARFQELVPQGDVRIVESGHDVVWDLGAELAMLIADWLEAA